MASASLCSLTDRIATLICDPEGLLRVKLVHTLSLSPSVPQSLRHVTGELQLTPKRGRRLKAHLDPTGYPDCALWAMLLRCAWFEVWPRG